jgi:hypothetical protein
MSTVTKDFSEEQEHELEDAGYYFLLMNWGASIWRKQGDTAQLNYSLEEALNESRRDGK